MRGDLPILVRSERVGGGRHAVGEGGEGQVRGGHVAHAGTAR